MDRLIGETLDRYTIDSLLGEGGMGAVFRAHHTALGHDVALKVIPAPLAGAAERLGRFRQEARVLASLQHPNIAAVFGIEEEAGVVLGEDPLPGL